MSTGIPIRPPSTFPHALSQAQGQGHSTSIKSNPSPSSSSPSGSKKMNGAQAHTKAQATSPMTEGMSRKQRRMKLHHGGASGAAGGSIGPIIGSPGSGQNARSTPTPTPTPTPTKENSRIDQDQVRPDAPRSPYQNQNRDRDRDRTSTNRLSPKTKQAADIGSQSPKPSPSPSPSPSTSTLTTITQPTHHPRSISSPVQSEDQVDVHLGRVGNGLFPGPAVPGGKVEKRHKRRDKKKKRLVGEEDGMGVGAGAPSSPGPSSWSKTLGSSSPATGERGVAGGQAQVDVQDEAGRSIALSSQDIVPTLSGLNKLVSNRLGLDESKTGLRLVHLRGQGQVVPIFDQPDYKYFLERSRTRGVGVQVLQVQVYPKDVAELGLGSRGGEKKRKRSDSLSGSDRGDDDENKEEAQELVSRKSKSARKKSLDRKSKRGSEVHLGPTVQTNKMDQPSIATDLTASDPDSPSPAPRRNIIPLGSRFKPAKPSPLGGTVVVRSPTASVGTNGSDGEAVAEDEDNEDTDDDVVMQDVAKVAPSNAKARQNGKKNGVISSREKKKQANHQPNSSDLDGFARAISEFASMLPSVSPNASSSSSTLEDHGMEDSSEEDTDDDEAIGEDTILDDESGITAAEAAKAYEQWKATKAKETEALRQREEAAAEKKRVKAEAAEQKRKEKVELEAKKKEQKARRKFEAEQVLQKKAEEKREREAEQEKKMQAARLELEVLTNRLAEKERLAAEASRPSSSQVEVDSNSPAGSSSATSQQTGDDSGNSDTESEEETEVGPENAVTAPPNETSQPNLTTQAAATLVASPIVPVVVAPASQEVDVSDSSSSSSSSTSSGSDDESSSDEDDTLKVANTPDPTPLQAVQAVTSIPRPAQLPSSSPEPYSDIEENEDEAPRQQKSRRRSQRSPSTDALIPEGDDDDDDDTSSIEATQPLVQFSQIWAPAEDIETADEQDDPMDVDVVEDFPLPKVADADTEVLVVGARKPTPGLMDPDATEDEDEQDHDDTQLSIPLGTATATAPPASVAVSEPTVSTPRAPRRSFADLADDIEASSSAVPSTGNQVFFEALQTEADVDQAGIREAATERAIRDQSSQPATNGDNLLVSDEAAVLQESQSDSMPDSTPTPAPNSRKSKLKAKEALIAQATELAALNANPHGFDQSTVSNSTNRADGPPVLRTEEEGGAPTRTLATTKHNDTPVQETPVLAEEAAPSIEIEVPIAPLPKRRGRPPKVKKPDAPPAELQASSAPSASQGTTSSQDVQRDVVGSSISPKALPLRETASSPASETVPLPVASSVSAPPPVLGPVEVRYQRLQELQSRKRVGTKPCLICDSIPAHLQKDCPVVIRGLASVEKRLKELKDASASPLAIDALQGWVVRLSNKNQQASKSASSIDSTPNKANAANKANASQTSVTERASTTNGTIVANGTPLSKRRPGVATRNNIPTLSSLRADALRKPRLAGGITKDAANTPTIEKASPFLRRGHASDDEESSSGTDSDSDTDGKGPALPASLAGRMANGIKTAKKAAVGAMGW